MGISPIIYDPSLLGFPDFPTTNQQIFSSPTAGANFTVPTGVTWIGVKCWAAGGGGSNGLNSGGGGAGSYAEILLEVYPGENLQLRVGGGGLMGEFNFNGGGYGGSNGGGAGGTASDASNQRVAGGGGGYSGVFTNNRPIIIVGGGGGGGGANYGAFGNPGGGSGSNGGNSGNDNGIVGIINNSYSGSEGLSSQYAGGGGGGGFRGGSGGSGGSGGIAPGGGGSGLSCAVLRDNMRNLIARGVKIFFIFSNGVPNNNGYLGYGNGGTGNEGGFNGRVEITY